MAPFVSAIELNRAFYREVVRPAVAPWHHSAALIGYGSQVLGYDDERSTDHGWGPRCILFVHPRDCDAVRRAVDAALPETFGGWPVRYALDNRPVQHHVEVWRLETWLNLHLGHDASSDITYVDWITTPQQKLLEVVRGAVYHDGLGALEKVRARLSYFPDEVWRWVIACQWLRISQEEAFVGRTAEVGDEIGSCLVAARLVRELMRLHFLYAREYWPYTKWFGTAYARLAGSDALLPYLHDAIAAASGADRERALAVVYENTGAMHNESAITDPLDPSVRGYYTRPFVVIGGERFAAACMETVSDPMLRALPPVGSIDQFVDSTEVLSYPGHASRVRGVYRP